MYLPAVSTRAGIIARQGKTMQTMTSSKHARRYMITLYELVVHHMRSEHMLLQ